MTKKIGKVTKPIMGTGAVCRFIRDAVNFESQISIEKDGTVGNAKSMMFVLSMGLDIGSEVTISASGNDEDAAVETLSEALGFSN